MRFLFASIFFHLALVGSVFTVLKHSRWKSFSPEVSSVAGKNQNWILPIVLEKTTKSRTFKKLSEPTKTTPETASAAPSFGEPGSQPLEATNPGLLEFQQLIHERLSQIQSQLESRTGSQIKIRLRLRSHSPFPIVTLVESNAPQETHQRILNILSEIRLPNSLLQSIPANEERTLLLPIHFKN